MQVKSYGTRGVADPMNHKIYSFYTKELGLKDADRADLKNRGLEDKHISNAGYASKGGLKEKVTYGALAKTNAEFKLDDVPGFYIDDKTGHRTTALVSGMVIGVYDYNGHIKNLLIRNDRAKVGKNGKVYNKYVTFSSSGKTKGARVYHVTHCPVVKGLPQEVAGVTIRLTEGVLKADITTALGDVYCIGLQGLDITDDLLITLEALQTVTVILCFDQGEDDNVDMIRKKGRLIKFLQDAGFEVKVEKWDASFGKGIDDVLHAGHADKVEYCEDEEIELMLKRAKQADPFTGEWRYCLTEKKVYNINTLHAWEKQQFADKFALVKADRVSELLAENKIEHLDRTTYWPGKGKFIDDMGMSCLNTWRDPGIHAIEGDVSFFLEFMNFLIPNELERKLAIQWFAYMIRNQGEKLMFALMIVGKQGVGKSLLAEMIKNILGHKNTVTPTSEQLHDNFNGYLQNICLAIMEETMAKGRQDIHNKVKPWITQSTIMIRDLNRAAFEYPNRFNMLFLTNFIDALPIDDDDRRFLMVKTTNDKNTDEFYSKVVAWMGDGMNISALLYYFNNVDLSDFNAKGKAPMTPTKQESIGSNLNPLEEYVINRMADLAYPFNRELVSVRHLRSRGVMPPGFDRYSDYKVAQALKKAGALLIEKQVILSDKSRSTLWAIGNQKNILSNPHNFDNDKLRKLYEEHLLDREPGNPIAEDQAL